MIYDKQSSFYLKGNEQLIKFESSNKYIRILKKFIYENINPNTFKNILDWLLAEMFWAFIDFHYYHYYYPYTFFAFDVYLFWLLTIMDKNCFHIVLCSITFRKRKRLEGFCYLIKKWWLDKKSNISFPLQC